MEFGLCNQRYVGCSVSVVDGPYTHPVGYVCPANSSCIGVNTASSGMYSWTVSHWLVSCPENSTAVSGGCQCNQGFNEATYGTKTICQETDTDPNLVDKNACFAFSAQETLPGGALTQDYRLQGNVSDGAHFCMPGAFDNPSKGCKVFFSRDSFLDYGSGKSVTEGSFSMSPDSNLVNQSCTVGDSSGSSPVPEKEKCSAGYTGVVNGVEVCVNKVPDSGVDGGKTDSETNDGTETKKVITDRNTTCENGVCTTTTTTTTTTTNNSTNTSNTSTTTNTISQTQAGFCTENPASRLCKDGAEDGSDFQGSCSSGFVCEGDAIQCAIAQEQHRRACKLFDDKNAESELYEVNKGKQGDQTGDLPGNEAISLAGRIDTSDALGGGSCIGDLNATVWGSTVTLPLSNLCQYLAMLGNILVAVSLLMAARIVTRG